MRYDTAVTYRIHPRCCLLLSTSANWYEIPWYSSSASEVVGIWVPVEYSSTLAGDYCCGHKASTLAGSGALYDYAAALETMDQYHIRLKTSAIVLYVPLERETRGLKNETYSGRPS